MRKFK